MSPAAHATNIGTEMSSTAETAICPLRLKNQPLKPGVRIIALITLTGWVTTTATRLAEAATCTGRAKSLTRTIASEMQTLFQACSQAQHHQNHRAQCRAKPQAIRLKSRKWLLSYTATKNNMILT